MPLYPYLCPNSECDHTWDVIKPMSESHTLETCPKCQAEAVKGVANFQVDKLCLTTGSGVSTESYNPGLGCMTKSTKDAERIAKSMGLEPAGSTSAEGMESYTKGRVEKLREERWAKADRELVFE